MRPSTPRWSALRIRPSSARLRPGTCCAPAWAGWGVADASGQVVTHRSAEHGLATVGACVQGIASAIASLPALVYRWEGDRRVEAPYAPAAAPDRPRAEPASVVGRLARADDGQRPAARQRASAEIIIDARGALVALLPIRWDCVSIVELPGGRIAYDVTDDARGGTRRLLEARCSICAIAPTTAWSASAGCTAPPA